MGKYQVFIDEVGPCEVTAPDPKTAVEAVAKDMIKVHNRHFRARITGTDIVGELAWDIQNEADAQYEAYPVPIETKRVGQNEGTWLTRLLRKFTPEGR